MSYSKRANVIFLISIIYSTLFLFKAPTDPDFGWHFKYGEYFFKHKKILRENIFSYNFTDYNWANSYFLSQIILYASHNFLGHIAAAFIFSLVLALSAFFYVFRLSSFVGISRSLVVFVYLFLVIELFTTGVVDRPMYFSSLFLMMLTTFLLGVKDRKKFWFLVLLFFIWANTHADFTLGLFVLGLFVLDVFISRFRFNLTLFLKEPLFWVFICCVLVSLANPYGLGLWQTLLKETHPYQFNHIIEWVPVSTESIYLFALFCFFMGLIVSSLIGAKDNIPRWYLLAIGFFSIFSIRSQYFMRINVILAIYVILVFWTPYFKGLARFFSAQTLASIKNGILFFNLFVLLLSIFVFTGEVLACLDEDYFAKVNNYPLKAMKYVEEKGISGNMFNYYGWGGFLIWKYPRYKTFIDGRMPSWRENNESIFETYVNITDHPNLYIKDLEKFNVDWVLYPTKSRFVRFLDESQSWEKVYSDDVASVLVRVR